MVQQTTQTTTNLSVYMNNDYVGLLTCDSRQRFSFQYDLQWISKKHVPPLSLSLPIREKAYSDEKARPFFTNLLPESAIQEAVARKLGISLCNDFGLLEALGGECAGAVRTSQQKRGGVSGHFKEKGQRAESGNSGCGN